MQTEQVKFENQVTTTSLEIMSRIDLKYCFMPASIQLQMMSIFENIWRLKSFSEHRKKARRGRTGRWSCPRQVVYLWFRKRGCSQNHTRIALRKNHDSKKFEHSMASTPVNALPHWHQCPPVYSSRLHVIFYNILSVIQILELQESNFFHLEGHLQNSIQRVKLKPLSALFCIIS